MDSSNGELTDAKKAWFAELKRMDKEVLHSGDGGALVHRAQQVNSFSALFADKANVYFSTLTNWNDCFPT
jgi:hypothetical protein